MPAAFAFPGQRVLRAINDLAHGQRGRFGRQEFHFNRLGVLSGVRPSSNRSGRPLPLETSIRGVFAIGDVRSGSVKRVGAAIGEGAVVVAELHAILANGAAASG
jgi:NADPH-dependent glutamate synthase beta subunit-like oxidoreductase